MSRRYAFLLIALAVIVAAAAVLRVVISGESQSPQQAGPSLSVASAPVDLPMAAATIAGVMPDTVASSPQADTTAAPAAKNDTEVHTSAVPLPDLLPTMDLTSSKIGQQRINALDAVGDVYRLAWHGPTKTLFMATVERDRMRSIWSLAANGTTKRVIEFNRLDGDFSVSVLKSGTLLAQFENPGRLYRSGDGGKTWSPVLYDTAMCWNFADDGEGTVYGGVHAVNAAMLLRSEDDGVTWHEWKNFQTIFPAEAVTYAAGDDRFRLRHLHDVALLGNRLFVGTGDVFRNELLSEDGGNTWKKTWDEGFTAHAADELGTKIVFAPDTLRRSGLVTFDAVTGAMKETWHPADYNYSGYSYSVLFKNGVFYAAFHVETNSVATVAPKFGVVASPDGYRWYPFLEYGPLTHSATTMLYLADGGDRVFLSVNGSLYGFKSLDADWFSFHQPFVPVKK